VLDDAGLRAMMAHLPALTHVEVASLTLLDNHADAKMASCCWEVLSLVHNAGVESLASLPLRRIKRVVLSSVDCPDDDSNSNNSDGTTTRNTRPVDAFAAALAAAPDCRFSCRPNWDILCLRCPVSRLPAMLPLLARWESFERLTLLEMDPWGKHLTPAAVDALGALLEGMPRCDGLALTFLRPSSTALLLPALTRTSVHSLILFQVHLSEAQLMLWCAGSQPGCPFTVTLRCSGGLSQEGFASVRAALAQSGSAVQLVEA
jgi:hypothetical protein